MKRLIIFLSLSLLLLASVSQGYATFIEADYTASVAATRLGPNKYHFVYTITNSNPNSGWWNGGLDMVYIQVPATGIYSDFAVNPPAAGGGSAGGSWTHDLPAGTPPEDFGAKPTLKPGYVWLRFYGVGWGAVFGIWDSPAYGNGSPEFSFTAQNVGVTVSDTVLVDLQWGDIFNGFTRSLNGPGPVSAVSLPGALLLLLE